MAATSPPSRRVERTTLNRYIVTIQCRHDVPRDHPDYDANRYETFGPYTEPEAVRVADRIVDAGYKVLIHELSLWPKPTSEGREVPIPVAFERECERVQRDCDGLARLYQLGQIDDAEFDRRARLILGSDYDAAA
jgi:hypothetical protein